MFGVLKMKIIVACEESQRITKELRLLGHEAFSCDIKPTTGENPEWHILGSILDHLNDGWDMMIAHPPCTYLTSTANRWLYNEDGTKNHDRFDKQDEAIWFVKTLMDAPIQRIAIENPVGWISRRIRKPDQVVQPWEFGDSFQKRTCWWLKNLPLLESTKIVDKGEFREYTTHWGEKKRTRLWMEAGKDQEERSTIRSRTFPGMAKAIAEQWTKE